MIHHSRAKFGGLIVTLFGYLALIGGVMPLR
jgi:hypothetical protein